MTFSRRAFLLLTLATLGCASGSAAPGAPREDRNKITAQQLARITADNAYEAVRLLQPQWLEARGATTISGPPASGPPTTAVVFIDGARLGDLEHLRSVQINSVSEIRYLTAGEASNRYGVGLPRGVIEVITKH
jgi:hypothetical protein